MPQHLIIGRGGGGSRFGGSFNAGYNPSCEDGVKGADQDEHAAYDEHPLVLVVVPVPYDRDQAEKDERRADPSQNGLAELSEVVLVQLVSDDPHQYIKTADERYECGKPELAFFEEDDRADDQDNALDQVEEGV